MAAIPAVLLFAGMLWFATRDKEGSERPAHEEAQEKYDQRPSSYVPVYDISGFNYCVYRISDPDGAAYAEYEGQDRMYFIAEKTEDPNDAMSQILETAAGPALYDTLPQARSALDTLYDAMNPDTGSGGSPSGPTSSGPVYTSNETGGTTVSSPAELPEGTITAEGREEGAMLDVEIYEGGSLVDSYSIENQPTIQTTTDLGGSL